ncbi:MAG: hypothetical protein KIS66_08525 [Fimbriimonadaceae bacterium]|nr:hypothetical protein [Fimbriimonadaceae bacterium]
MFLNRDQGWDVEVYRGRVRPPKRMVLKPGQGREQTFDLTLEGKRGYEDLEFVAYAHDSAVADKTLRVDARTQPRLGIVFQRDAEGNPALFVLTNPDSVEWTPVRA